MLGQHLNVPGISYVLALLRLPGLYMASYFVRGVETMSELGISLRRLDAFLSLPEPPPPLRTGGSGNNSGKVGVDDLPLQATVIVVSGWAPTHTAFQL